MRTKCCRVSCPQRLKLQRVSSMSPPLPPGLSVSKSSQKAGVLRPQLPGGERDGTCRGTPAGLVLSDGEPAQATNAATSASEASRLIGTGPFAMWERRAAHRAQLSSLDH